MSIALSLYIMMLYRHCNNNVAATVMSEMDGKSVSFTVTLPARTASLLEGLTELGLLGGTRAEVAKTIIMRGLIDFAAMGLISVRRSSANTPSIDG